MNPIQTLINDTLALDEKATAGPWRKTRVGVRGNGNYGSMQIVECSSFDGEAVDETNAALIAAFRSSAPKLARIAKIAVEALEDAPHAMHCKVYSVDIAKCSIGTCTCWKSRALAAIEREAGK